MVRTLKRKCRLSARDASLVAVAAFLPFQVMAKSASPDPGSALKALGQQYQSARDSLRQARDTQIRGLLTPDQLRKYGTDESISISREQAAQLKAIEGQYLSQSRKLDREEKQRVAALYGPEEYAAQEALAAREKADAVARLPVEEQRIATLMRQSGEQMEALRASYEAQLKALLTPSQLKASEDDEAVAYTPEQLPAVKALQGPYLSHVAALQADTAAQLEGLLSTLSPEQAAKYRKPSAKGGFVVTDAPQRSAADGQGSKK